MISSNRTYDFLFINYIHKDFIVNRSQFSGSVMYNKAADSKSPYRYFSDIIYYGSQSILTFDIDNYLRDNFNVISESDSRLCIISEVTSFPVETRNFFHSTLFKGAKGYSKELLAFTIISKSEINKYNIFNFKLLSNIYSRPFFTKGIISCSFTDNRIQYFIDINTIAINSIKNDNMGYKA